MKRLFLLFTLLPIIAFAGNGPYETPYGVAATFDFKLYNTDGTLDVDEVDGGAEVSVACDEGEEGTATNDFVPEGTFYSIALTAAELSCERTVVVVAATDTEVFFIRTTEGGVPDKFHALADATGTPTTTDLTGAASATVDFYNGDVLKIYDVSAAAWYEATITDYVGSTNIATHTTIPAAAASGDALLVKNQKKTALTVSNGVVEANAVQIEGTDPSDLVNAAADTALTDYDAATGAELATAQADLDTLTGSDGATLATSQPNYAPATAAAVAALNDPSATAIRDAIMQYTLDNSITFEMAACHMMSVLLGEAAFTSGSPDQTVFQDPTGTDTRVTIEYGSDNGDRTSVTLSATNCGSN